MQPRLYLRLSLIAAALLLAAVACQAVAGGSAEADRGRPGSSAPSGAPAGGAGDGSGATVAVTLQEFSVNLDPAQVGSGPVTFVVTNNGHIPHDFAIRGQGVDEKTPMLSAGETARLEVTLEAGEYEYECTVEGHAMLGMKGTLTAAP